MPTVPTSHNHSDTVFGKILAGDIPCHRVYEDDWTLAFLDIEPLSRGHVLVIPKEPAPHLDALSEQSAGALGVALVRVARAVKQATGASDFNVLQNNGAAASQSVFHVHFHIIPKTENGDGLQMAWRTQELKDPVELARAIAAAL